MASKIPIGFHDWVCGVFSAFRLSWIGSNWNQLIPDLIVALATGLFVGLIFLVAQRRREGWAERLASRVGSSQLVHPLLLALQMTVDDQRFRSIAKLSRKRSTRYVFWNRSLLNIGTGSDLHN